ncbi:Developmental and secondary metabolism regulator veA [Penicillium lividum]|nr:Developmental and secondary metabolism regulator veA [Penicillium lividum]
MSKALDCPSHCSLCEKSVTDWDNFYKCFKSHCRTSSITEEEQESSHGDICARQGLGEAETPPTQGFDTYTDVSVQDWHPFFPMQSLDSTTKVGLLRKSQQRISSTARTESHEDSFGIDERSMRIGMRPVTEPNPNAYRDFSAESRAALMAELGVEMAYKRERANGRTVMKAPQ